MFFCLGYQRHPLRIGIFDDLRPLVSLTEDDLKAALRRYTAADGYLVACTEGAIRAQHAAHAQKVLAQRERGRLQDQENRAKEKATQRPQTIPAMGPKPTERRRRPVTPNGDNFSAPQQPPSTPRRIGFAEGSQGRQRHSVRLRGKSRSRRGGRMNGNEGGWGLRNEVSPRVARRRQPEGAIQRAVFQHLPRTRPATGGSECRRKRPPTAARNVLRSLRSGPMG